mmetsp:Transcript_28455/g.59408  ORF Transcript_28455/g.59408 Transcript_28455/m.59408 type:complete len:280 (-) Transcript_28455:345-1184(-)
MVLITEKVIYVARHAEALHNIKEREAVAKAKSIYGEHETEELERARKAVLKDEALKDAPLSPPGVSDVREKSDLLHLLNDVGRSEYPCPQIVLVSPLRRALMTATELFQGTVPPPKFVALEVLREKRTGFAADERSHVDILEQEFPHVDFSDLRVPRPEILPGEDNAALQARTQQFLDGALLKIPQETLAFVTHKGWLRELRHSLTERVEAGKLKVDFDLENWDQTLYKNAEVRIAKCVWADDKMVSLLSRSVEQALGSYANPAKKFSSSAPPAYSNNN